jgi:hypothetical protein
MSCAIRVLPVPVSPKRHIEKVVTDEQLKTARFGKIIEHLTICISVMQN